MNSNANIIMRTTTIFALLFACFSLSAQVDCGDITIKDFLNFVEGEEAPYTGECVSNDPTGQLIQRGSFKDGKKIGLWQSWHGNGKKRSESPYVDNLLHGTEYKWFSNEQLESEDTYVGGVRSGKYVAYYETGQKKFEFSFNMGLKTGTYTYYHPNGQKWEQGKYVNDLHQGVWWVWDANGNKTNKRVYNKDEVVSENVYNDKSE